MMPTNTTNMKTFAAADGLKFAYYVDDFTRPAPWRTPDTLLLLHAAMGSALRWFIMECRG
jgi:3-oxoadipate enol-lactonase